MRKPKKSQTHRAIDAVIAPIWDCEGLAFLLDGGFTLITSLQTTLKFWLDSHGHVKSELGFDFVCQADAGRGTAPIPALQPNRGDQQGHRPRDRRSLRCRVRKMSQLTVVPIGLEDWDKLDWRAPEALPQNSLRILFVGRLEERKGIDVFLEAVKQVLPEYSEVFVELSATTS